MSGRVPLLLLYALLLAGCEVRAHIESSPAERRWVVLRDGAVVDTVLAGFAAVGPTGAAFYRDPAHSELVAGYSGGGYGVREVKP